MNILKRKELSAICVAGFKLVFIGLLTAPLWGCGGDSGIDVGSGQSADPVVLDYPLFYVKKPLRLDDAGDIAQADLRELLPAEFGADLFMRVRASSSAPEINLTAGQTGGFGDVRDVSISHDGSKVLFSMRAPIDPDAADEDQPSWNIWEYDVGAESLLRIFSDNITAEEGHDIGAQYLPDGRIIFSSTRQNQSVAKLTDQGRPQYAALDEDRNEPAFVLHVMNADGTDLQQVSFNQSHDLYPTVLDNGRIMFSRWDGIAREPGISLYSANPDGTDLQLLYGADSHATGSLDPATGENSEVHFIKARELQDGRIIALTQPFSGTFGGGDLVIIDGQSYLNNTQSNVLNSGGVGPAQLHAAGNAVSTIPGGISAGGRFNSVWPLRDGTNRALVGWSVCRLRILPVGFDPQNDALPGLEICSAANLANSLAVDAEPAFGIWMLDLTSGNLRPVILAEIGAVMSEIVIGRAKPLPTVVLDLERSGLADPGLLSARAGLLHIRSVYDFNGADGYGIATLADPAQSVADDRPARFVRIYKAVGIPDEETRDLDNSAFGVSRRFGMREIVGYAPVEPDGSVYVEVPADTPLSIDVLDRNGRRIFAAHTNWLQVRPGEVRECNGCHNPNLDGVSHGRSDAFDAVNAGAPVPGYNFPNTLFSTTADLGETMAANRARYSCFTDCAYQQLSIDLDYADVWTNPAVRPRDTAFSLSYAGITTQLPERDNCVPWTVNCKVIINYEQHIQPLWEVARLAIDPDPAALVNSCVDCHALRDRGGLLIDPDLGRGQLELTSNPSAADADQYTSYRELLAGDTLESIQNGAVQELLRFQGNFDIDGNPLDEPVAIGSPLTAGYANAHREFFTRFTNPGTHQGWLTEDELRLIAEWLDIGAQYFNNPFDPTAPVN